jgi:hypothetical protein
MSAQRWALLSGLLDVEHIQGSPPLHYHLETPSFALKSESAKISFTAESRPSLHAHRGAAA